MVLNNVRKKFVSELLLEIGKHVLTFNKINEKKATFDVYVYLRFFNIITRN